MRASLGITLFFSFTCLALFPVMGATPQLPITIADWTFENGSPGQMAVGVPDSSGRGHNGVAGGTPVYISRLAPDHGNIGLHFDGASSVFAGTSTDFNFKNDDFTLEAIVTPGPGNISANRGIIVAQSPENGALSYVLDYRSESHTANFAVVAADGANDFVSVVIPEDSQPHHIAGIRAGNTLSIYLDRQLVQSRNSVLVMNLPDTGGAVLRLGASSAGYNFDGIIDRVRMTRGVLNPEDFAIVTPYVPGTVADWTFDDGNIGQIATSVTDSSGKNHHGSVFGPAYYIPSQTVSNGTIALQFSTSSFRPSDSRDFNFRDQDFTLEAVLKPGDGNINANRGVIVAQNPENGRLAYVLDYRSESRTANFALADAGGANEFVTAVVPQDGQVHHLGAVRQGQNISIYLDKQLVQSRSTSIIPNLPEFGRVELRAGGSSAGYNFDGIVERVRISRGALPPEAFAWVVPPIATIPDGITVADWTFEEGIPGQSAGVVLDHSGNGLNSQRMIGNPAFTPTVAPEPGNVSLRLPPGSAAYFGLSTNFSLRTEFTLEVSMNPGTNNFTWHRGVVVAQNGRQGNLSYGMNFFGDTRAAEFFIYGASGDVAVTSATVPDDGRSHHFAGVYTGSRLLLYRDGLLADSVFTSLIPNISGPVELTVGANSIGGFWYEGLLDRVRISRKALSPDEFFPFAGDSGSIIVQEQPSNILIAEGDSSQLRVLALSALPLSYQWYKDGLPISETSNILVLRNVTALDSGDYSVRISNASNTIESAVARVTVFSPATQQLINIDYGAHQNPFFSTKTGTAAAGMGTNDVWNLYSRDDGSGGYRSSGAMTNLVWSDNSPSSVDLTVQNAAGAWYTLNSDPMFQSYLYPLGGGEITSTLSDVPQGAWDVYVYAHGQPAGENGVIDLTTDMAAYGTRATSTAADWDSPGWTEGKQYVLWTGVLVHPGERITIRSTAGSTGLAVINGVQLVRRSDLPVESSFTVADWTFEEGMAGTPARVAADHSMGGTHRLEAVAGTNATFVPTGEGAEGRISVSFNPSATPLGASLASDDSTDFNLAAAFTIEASLRPGALNTNAIQVIAQLEETVSGRVFAGLDYRGDTRTVRFKAVDPAGGEDFVSVILPSDPLSHVISGVMKNRALSIYFDGNLISSVVTPRAFEPIPAAKCRVTVGANFNGSHPFQGTMDRVRISNKALAPGEFLPVNTGSGLPLVLTKLPEDLQVEAGATAVLESVAGGPSGITYSWSFHGQEISTSNRLVLNNIQLSQAGEYQVTARAGAQTVSAAARVAVFATSTPVPLRNATATFSQSNGDFSVDHAINGTEADNLGWAIAPALQSQTAVFETVTNVGSANQTVLTFRLFFSHHSLSGYTSHTLGRFRLSVTTDARDAFADGLPTGGDVSASWIVLDPDAVAAEAAVLTELPDHSILASGPISERDIYTITAITPVTGITGVRLEALTDAGLPWGGPGREPINGNFVVSEFTVSADRGTDLPPVIVSGLTNVIAGAGETAVFTVNAAGGAPLTYSWSFNGQVLSNQTSASLILTNVQIEQAGSYTVTVRQGEKEVSSSATLAVLTQRILVPETMQIQEGARVILPILVSSQDDVSGMSFEVTYDTNLLADAQIVWSDALSTAFYEVNNSGPGRLGASFVFAGETLGNGTQAVAQVQFRARSVPQLTSGVVEFDGIKLFSLLGNEIPAGSSRHTSAVQISPRKYQGDNNGNDRLDVADASAILRMVTGLDPVRAWDISGNDLNQNSSLDAGDAVRVLRAVVLLDPQPGTPAQRLARQSFRVASTGTLTLTADKPAAKPGEQITVHLALNGAAQPVAGASFRLQYPAASLRLDSAAALQKGSLIPTSALALWNVSPDQNNFANQDGTVYGAFSTPLAWPSTNGEIASFTFTVQPGATSASEYVVQISNAELSDGYDSARLNPVEIAVHGIGAAPAELSLGSYDTSTGAFSLKLDGTSAEAYRVDVSDDLQSWKPLGTFTPVAGEVIVRDPEAGAHSERFYRAVRE